MIMPGVLQSMGSQRVRHYWSTKMNSPQAMIIFRYTFIYIFIHSKTMYRAFTACSEGDEPWDFFGRNDAKAETPVLWPPHAKSWLIGKDFDAVRDWGQEEKGTTEDEMAEWHHWLDGHESEWTLGVGDGQGGLACCSSWGRKESDTTERQNWTELRDKIFYRLWFPGWLR